LLAEQRRATTAGQQAEALVEPSRELIDTQRGHPRRRQFQRQGNSIQPCTDLHNGGRVAFTEHEVRLNSQRPLGEQPDCGVALELGDWRPLLPIRRRQRRHAPGDLAGDPQCFATGRQCAYVRAILQKRSDQARAGVEQVFAVVQHQ
jgi:hypothetical protein